MVANTSIRIAAAQYDIGFLRNWHTYRAKVEQWVAAAVAVRAWALEHPHEYALLYGTPVPGYEAPVDTVDPGTRVSRLLVGIVHEAGVDATAISAPRLSRELRAELRHTVDEVAPGMPVEVFFAALVAWTQLFGLISFELFGRINRALPHRDEYFDHQIGLMADLVGLP